MNEPDFVNRKRGAARWSVFSNSALLVLKIIAGVATGSVGVLAEVVHSAVDLVGSLVSWLSVRASDEPPDETHAYGHGKIENLSGVLTASLILGGGAYTIWEALRHLQHTAPLTHIGWAIGAMLASILVNVFVSRNLLRVGLQTESPALIADGHHLKTDVWSSLAVLLGLSLSALTQARWCDAVAALIVSILILRIGYELAREALRTLADESLSSEEERTLADTIRAHPGVLGFHKLRTRRSGSHRHVDVHVQIADTHSFVEAHHLTEELEDNLREALPNLHPIIHIEPFEDEEAHQRERHGAAEK